MDYLFSDVNALLLSTTFVGDRTFAQEPRYEWYEWLYIAAYKGYTTTENTEKVKIKFGKTQDRLRRNAELETSSDNQLSSTIIYAWSVPKAQVFETTVQRFLKNFIFPQSMELLERPKNKNETIWAFKIAALIKIMRICILCTCVQENYVPCTLKRRKALKRMMEPPNVITYDDDTFVGKKQTVRKILAVEDMYAQIQQMFGSMQLFPFCKKARPQFDVFTDANLLKYIFGQNGAEIQNNNIPDALESEILHADHVEEQPDELDLDLNAYVYAQYEDIYYPAQVRGYGIGPDFGKYLVMWLAYRPEGGRYVPRTRNGIYYANTNASGNVTYSLVEKVTLLSNIYPGFNLPQFNLRF